MVHLFDSVRITGSGFTARLVGRCLSLLLLLLAVVGSTLVTPHPAQAAPAQPPTRRLLIFVAYNETWWSEFKVTY